jgi:putative membrane protein
MKTIKISLFTACLLAVACINEGTDSAEKTDSSTTATSTMDSPKNRMADANAKISSPTFDETGSAFLVKAALASMAEVEEAELAQRKAINQAVKDFATMILNDHSTFGIRIKGLAAPRNVDLPATVTRDEQKIMDDLRKKTGTTFDLAYMDVVVKDHQKDINEFEDAAGKVSDAEIKSFIANAVPTLKMHLDSARAIQNRIK